MRKLNNQKGSLVIEIALGILVLAALGFGIYEAHQNNVISKNAGSDTSVQHKKTASTKTTAGNVVLSTSQAAAIVGKFYNDSSVSPGNAQSLQPYATSNLVAQLASGQYKAMYCSQSVSKFSLIKSSTLKGDYVDVDAVLDHGNNPPLPNDKYDVDVKVVKDGASLKIDGINKDGTAC
jgi:hypothetical protein